MNEAFNFMMSLVKQVAMSVLLFIYYECFVPHKRTHAGIHERAQSWLCLLTGTIRNKTQTTITANKKQNQL